uniref:ShKT domain-containing protein n=1 Tax=Parastrongyloides trichosuri TaxID=131310 RepID=A0A0N4ZDB5_PARTI
MSFSKLLTILAVYLIVSPKCKAPNTRLCGAAADCTGGLFCVSVGAEYACVAPCTVAQEVSICGGAGTCVLGTDIANQNVYTCAQSRGCLTDNECMTANPATPICNIYTLQCIATPGAVTTTTYRPTTTRIVDSIVGGLYDCANHARYCYDPLWLPLMMAKCPATCASIRIAGITGITGVAGITGVTGLTGIPGLAGITGIAIGNAAVPAGNNGCRDVLADCVNKRSVCQLTPYKNFVNTYCRYTCGLC